MDGVIRARKRCESDENGIIRVILAFCATTWRGLGVRAILAFLCVCWIGWKSNRCWMCGVAYT